MAVAVPDPSQTGGGASAAQEALRHIARLLSGLWSVSSIQKVALSSHGGQVDLWVLTREESPEDEARIFALGREYRNAVGMVPFDLHVFPLSEIDPTLLPPAETLFER